jgi:ketosteroid isomerase-like protein
MSLQGFHAKEGKMRKLAFFLGTLLAALGASGAAVPLLAQIKSTPDAKAEIEALEQRYNEGFNARDLKAIMSCYAPGKGLFVFDAVPPREYASWDAYKRDWEGLLSAFPGPATNVISEQSITVVGLVAYGHNIQSGNFTRKDGSKLQWVVRVTDVYRKIKDKWLIVQEHVSFPVDLESGKADLLSKP